MQLYFELDYEKYFSTFRFGTRESGVIWTNFEKYFGSLRFELGGGGRRSVSFQMEPIIDFQKLVNPVY